MKEKEGEDILTNIKSQFIDNLKEKEIIKDKEE